MPASTPLARSFRLVSLLSVAFASLQACGGRSDTEDYLFDEAPGGGTTSVAGTRNVGGSRPGGSAGTTSTGAVTGTGGSGAVPGGASGVGGGSSGSAAGGLPGMGGVSQGGMAQGGMAQGGVAQGGAGVAGSVTGGQPGSPVTCGASICSAPAETCCATLGGFGCIPAGQSCAGATLDCGASSDCGGNDVCCLQIVGNSSVGSSCKNNCSGMGSGRERQLCTTDQECQGNRRCRDTVFGVRVCTRF